MFDGHEARDLLNASLESETVLKTTRVEASCVTVGNAELAACVPVAILGQSQPYETYT